MFDSKISPMASLVSELATYEETSSLYLLGRSKQRDIQVFIIKRTLAKYSSGMLTKEQAYAILYALKKSIADFGKALGLGSKLKAILNAFFEHPEVKSYTEELIATVPDKYRRSEPVAVSLDHPLTTLEEHAAANFLKELSILASTSVSSGAYTLSEVQHSLLVDEIKEVLIRHTDDALNELDITSLDTSSSDAFLMDFKTMPLHLVRHQGKHLYSLILEEIKKHMPDITEEAAEEALLKQLPVSLRADFSSFLNDDDFFTDEELTLYFLSNHDFAKRFIEGRFSVPKTRGRLIDEVAMLKRCRVKINNVLKCIFILTAQLNSTDRALFLADSRMTSFESLMGYVISIPTVINIGLYRELQERRQAVIEKYLLMRRKGEHVTNQILQLLKTHGYDLRYFSNQNDIFAILRSFERGPDSVNKRAVIRALNTLNPVTMTSLMQDLTDSAATATSLRFEAASLVSDTLQVCIDAEATQRGLVQIQQALHKKLVYRLKEYLEELIIARACELIPVKIKEVSDGKLRVPAGENLRLITEIAALRAAVDEIMPIFVSKFGDYVDIRYNVAECVITKPTSDGEYLTAAFDASALHIKPSAQFDLDAVGTLMREHPSVLQPALEYVVHDGLMVQGIKAVSYGAGRLIVEEVELPAAKSYQAACDKKFTPPAFSALERTHVLTKNALTALMVRAIEDYYKRMGGGVDNPDKNAYARQQVLLKFKDVGAISFDSYDKPSIELYFEPMLESPDQFMQRVKRILNQSNRSVFSMWRDSDTVQAINQMLQQAGGLRTDSGVLLYKLDSSGHLVLAPSSVEREQVFVEGVSTVFFSESVEALKFGGDVDEALSEADPKEFVDASFEPDEDGACVPVFPVETLTERACR